MGIKKRYDLKLDKSKISLKDYKTNKPPIALIQSNRNERSNYRIMKASSHPN